MFNVSFTECCMRRLMLVSWSQNLVLLYDYQTLLSSWLISNKSSVLVRFQEEDGVFLITSVLAWRIPGTGEPGELPSMGSHRVGHDWSDLAAAAGPNRSFPGGSVGKKICLQCRRPGFNPWVGNILWRREWLPLQYSCLESFMNRGAWWATGVANSWI